MHHLEVGDDPVNCLPALGLVINGVFIADPFASEYGCFKVDPAQTYGLTVEEAQQLVEFNKLIDTATQAAINAGCLEVQKALGVSSGDLAGMHFSGSDAVRPIAQAVAEYILAEYSASVHALDEVPELTPERDPQGQPLR